jgi:hypothetical protein
MDIPDPLPAGQYLVYALAPPDKRGQTMLLQWPICYPYAPGNCSAIVDKGGIKMMMSSKNLMRELSNLLSLSGKECFMKRKALIPVEGVALGNTLKRVCHYDPSSRKGVPLRPTHYLR